ncbi:MAG TPA: DUF4013 domain-containing protein [Methanobacteriaceae archaeon]|nr:DUF4013 domain-containing protein [Methanobacteriaceae archaeon]
MMNFSQVFIDALRYPFTDINKFFIMIILSLGSFLIIPGIMALGYSLRIIECTITGSNELPDFKGTDKLLEAGIKFIAASIIYGIPTYIVIFSSVIYGIRYGNPDLNMGGPYYMLILAIISFLVSIVFTLALVNMVVENKFGAAFNFKKIFGLIKNLGWGTYLSYLVVYAIIVEILSFVVGLANPHLTNISAMSFMGVFAISFLFNAYLLMFGGRFKGIIYLKCLEKQTNPDE